MAFWPRVLLVLLAAFSVLFILRGTLNREGVERLDPRAAVLIGLGLVYVLALDTLGFVAATLVFTFVLSLWLQANLAVRSAARAAVVAGGATACVYLLFSFGLNLRLPGGLF